MRLLGDTPIPQFPYFLWRRERSKETSTLPKAPPYMEGMQLIPRETLFIRVLVWFAKPVPFGRTILSYIPAIAAPLTFGLACSRS